jgi:tRNA pseudouridine32 synthase/23S rRNA pseudouridine746 synthase
LTEPFHYQPPAEPWPKILYQDKDVLVVEKPSGLLSNPGRGAHLQDSVLSRLSRQFPAVYLIHRLDLATSGLMVFALRRSAERDLKQQFASRQVDKTYLARVAGVPVAAAGYIDLPLAAVPAEDPGAAPRNQVCFSQGKAAQTYYRVLWQHADSALLQLKPITGRSHQLRVHLASLGHPILGDTIYATPAQQQAAPHLLLHATALTFRQPYSGEPLSFICPPELPLFGPASMPALYTTQQMLQPTDI